MVENMRPIQLSIRSWIEYLGKKDHSSCRIHLLILLKVGPELFLIGTVPTLLLTQT